MCIDPVKRDREESGAGRFVAIVMALVVSIVARILIIIVNRQAALVHDRHNEIQARILVPVSPARKGIGKDRQQSEKKDERSHWVFRAGQATVRSMSSRA